MKKNIFITISILVVLLYWYYSFPENVFKKSLEVPSITTSSDIDKDWLNDILDIIEGARKEVKNKTTYKSAYYSGGYPPDSEWVCSDVVWRAFQNAWIDLKSEVDSDIKNHISFYPRVEGQADPNIDFRRVPNLQVFFERNAISLTTKVIPWDIENLKEWQAGDIVIFWKPKDHIAIVSDKRDKDWVPYIIHNSAPVPKENDWLVYWDKDISPIIGHYRLKYREN